MDESTDRKKYENGKGKEKKYKLDGIEKHRCPEYFTSDLKQRESIFADFQKKFKQKPISMFLDLFQFPYGL